MTENYIKWPQNLANGREIDQASIKYTSIFHRKTLQNFTKIGIFGLKSTIWQPCLKVPDQNFAILENSKT
jgi:hypothetical protein